MSTSFLDKPVLLSELIEPDLFAELCGGYSELYRVPIKVYDSEGHKIVDVGRPDELTEWLFDFPEARRAITEFITALRRVEVDVDERKIVDDPICGTRYLLLPITYDFELLGKLVCGPYVSANAPEGFQPQMNLGPQFEAEAYSALRNKLRRLSDAAMRQRMRLLVASVDACCHAGYRSLLTSNMHLESITEAYDELQKANLALEAKNEELVAHNARLRELDELKSNFLATVSHELRTPLTSVIGYSEMLLEDLAGPLNDEQREYIQTIMERGESLLGLISGILDISKIERGAHGLSLEPVEIPILVSNALDSVRPQAHKSEVQLIVDLDPALPAQMMDRYKVRQTLINLLGNAVKFTPQGGRVTVRCVATKSKGRGGVVFAVVDTGIGIPRDQLEQVFEAFFQVDNSSTREYGGTGLGLSIVKSFVESHEGEVSVESNVGQGTTFSFFIPTE